ncbi:hypothetical protein M0R45_035397 [Rubus argutus]|uniref:Elongin-A n=1 Tax=Rubus argutus TaxID=59490 RepID=A0AAW1VVI5_RUBAR
MNQADQKGKALSFAAVSAAIDNRRFLGDVSDMDLDVLEQILPHCSKAQLTRIEKSTKGRDLSLVTDKLWKRFYETEFGIKSTELLIEVMKEANLTLKWSEMYREKSNRVKEVAEKKVRDRLKVLHRKEDARKQSRQVRVCEKVQPSSSNKRNLAKQVTGPKSKLMKRVIS